MEKPPPTKLRFRKKLSQFGWLEKQSWIFAERDCSTYLQLLEVYQDLYTAEQLTLVALALYEYRLREGKLPDSLDALVPDYFDSLPVDPYGGAHFRYQPHDEHRFILYSIGSGFEDDGGTQRVSGRSTDDDIFWKWVAEPGEKLTRPRLTPLPHVNTVHSPAAYP